MADRTRRIGFRLAAIAIGLLACLVLSEVIVRVLPRRLIPELYPSPRHKIGAMIKPSDNPNLYFELVADDPKTEVNADGYRGPICPEQKPDGVSRIVGIGDSTLFGYNLPYKKTLLAQLEQMLGSSSVQAVNLAVPAYDTHQELEVLRTRALQFEPDLVVLGYDHNDPIPLRPKQPLLPDSYGDNVLHSQLLRYLMRKLRSYDLKEQDKLPEGNLAVDSAYHAGPLWDDHLKALEQFVAFTSSRDIPVVVVIYCPLARLDPELKSEHHRLITEPLVSFFRKQGAHVVSTYHLFQEYMRERKLKDMSSLWLDPSIPDVHPSPEGHRLIARATYELIKKERLLKD